MDAAGSQDVAEDSVELLNELRISKGNKETGFKNQTSRDSFELTLFSMNLRRPGKIINPLSIPNANALPEIMAILLKFIFKFIVGTNSEKIFRKSFFPLNEQQLSNQLRNSFFQIKTNLSITQTFEN